MKKLICLSIVAMMAFTGCGTKTPEATETTTETKTEATATEATGTEATTEENTEATDDSANKYAGVVNYDKYGFSLGIPEVWQKVYGSRLMDVQNYSPDFVGYVSFVYISQETQDAFNKAIEEQGDTSQFSQEMIEINSIAVVTDEQKESDAVKEKFATYKNVEELGTGNGYTYYNLYNDTTPVELTEASKAEYDGIIGDMTSFNSVFKVEEIKEFVMDFEGKDLAGNPVTSKELFGGSDYTLINVWATYCTPCITELPVLEEVYQEFKDKGINVIGFASDANTQDTLEISNQMAADAKLTFTSVIPESGSAIEYLTSYISAVPTTIIVDKNGKIVSEQIVGANDKAYFEQVLNDILANK